MIREDGQVIHFNNPKVQASIAANTFAITGHAETKRKYTTLFRSSYFLIKHMIVDHNEVQVKSKALVSFNVLPYTPSM